MKRLLIVAFHFPPLAGSSGIQRTLRFVQHLPKFGWEAIVLTCRSNAYEQVKPDLLGDIPAGTVVKRAFALDSARQLAIFGRYPGFLARPDRWVSWWPAATISGLNMIRKYRPAAIFSTYPIATAHMIANSLSSYSKLPWVADFRDPMAQDGYPPDPRTWQSFKRIEEGVFARAAACTVTTRSAAAAYRDRYPDSNAEVVVVENGYDEETFSGLVADKQPQPLNPGVFTILHSGIVYPSERDPTKLFEALRALKRTGVGADKLIVRFRAAVHDHMLASMAAANGVADMIETLPHIPYREALNEMLRADALMVMQAANCDAQVPAKLYEYLRAYRPVIALTNPAGDTAGVLSEVGIHAIANLDSAAAIETLLRRLLAAPGDRADCLPDRELVLAKSRLRQTEKLARLLDGVVSRTAEGRRT